MRAFGLVIMLIVSVLPSTWGQQQKPAHSEQTTTANPKPNSAVSKPDDHPCTDKQADTADSQSQHWPPPWWSGFWTNWGLVIVGVFAVIAALWTLSAIRGQNKPISENATAARSQAEAIINSERPWIFIEQSESTKASDPRKAYVKLLGKNKGRTPAEVMVISCEFTWVRDDFRYPDEPTYPNEELKYRKYVTSDDEPFTVYEFDCSEVIFDERIWEEKRASHERLTFTGRVVYRDLITHKEHETRFCYLLSGFAGVRLVMTGPRTYNQHT